MTTDPATSLRTAAAIAGRRADTTRRRERVLTALTAALANGITISVATIAHAAGVDRSFLYRHHDLLERIHTAQTKPPEDPTRGPAPSRASLQADLAAAHERTTRLTARIRQLEHRLSQVLGQQTWQESGLGAPSDVDQLNTRITALEQQNLDLQIQLDERDQELTAARAANRELMTQLNTTTDTPS